jgi:hypothetical protein
VNESFPSIFPIELDGNMERTALSGVNKVTEGFPEYPLPPLLKETETILPPKATALALADVVDAPTNVSEYVPSGYPLPIPEIAIVVTLPPVIVDVNVAAIGVFRTAENVTGLIGEISKSKPEENMSRTFVFAIEKYAVGTTVPAIEAVIVGFTSAGRFTNVFAVAVTAVTT